MTEKCENCGKDTENENEICEGALLEERSQGVNTSVQNLKGLVTCNCCNKCRQLCAKDWHDENYFAELN